MPPITGSKIAITKKIDLFEKVFGQKAFEKKFGQNNNKTFTNNSNNKNSNNNDDVEVAKKSNNNKSKSINNNNNNNKNNKQPSFGTGCLICGSDDDEDKILLCENCDGEYHIYCLQPSLKSVPIDDWYCDNCVCFNKNKNNKAINNNNNNNKTNDDGMDICIKSLPTSYTSRFGEICWAYGGSGYGWWPSIIFDPRLTVEPARSQAKKYLGIKYLVYFFQCPDSPFSILHTKQIKNWFNGLCVDMHLGKTAKIHSKTRYQTFKYALQLACLDMDKPLQERLEWEYEESKNNNSPLTSRKSITPNNSKHHNKRKRKQNDNGTSLRKELFPPPSSIHGNGSSSQYESAFRPYGNNNDNNSNKKRKGHHHHYRHDNTGAGGSRLSDASRIRAKHHNNSHTSDSSNNNSSTSSSSSSSSSNNDEEVNHYAAKTDNNYNNNQKSTGSSTNNVPDRISINNESSSKKLSSNNNNNNNNNSKLVCTIIQKELTNTNTTTTVDNSDSSSVYDEGNNNNNKNIGFVILPSRTDATFANLRKTIIDEIDPHLLPQSTPWNFYVPNLGIVSKTQENKLQPVYQFIKLILEENNQKIDAGTFKNPLKIYIVKLSAS